MKFSDRRVKIIIALIVIALSGLILLQTSLLSNAMELKEQAFNSNVQSAMGQINQSLASGEAIMVAIAAEVEENQHDISLSSSINTKKLLSHDSVLSKRVFQFNSNTEPPVRYKDGAFFYTVSSPEKVRIEIVSGSDNTIIVDSFHQPGEYKVPAEIGDESGFRYVWRYETDSTSMFMHINNGQEIDFVTDDKRGLKKKKLVASVFENLLSNELIPIEERLDSLNIDSVVKVSLANAGIDQTAVYGVISSADDSLRLISDVNYSSVLRDSPYQTKLFPQDIFAEPANLILYFPDHTVFIWGQIIPMLLATVILMVIIIICFVYTFRTIFKQRRFASLMKDFINNMTHEFKTPISTIALATEAISRSDVRAADEKLVQFNEMIAKENKRMKNQTDKILQMAILEEKDYDLSLENIELHQMLDSIIDSNKLRVEHLSGSITKEFKANAPMINGDRVHLQNIFHNLLDNAVKYSNGSPVITIRTFDSRDNQVSIRVEDQGIGIKPEDMKFIFEKYYRVSTGNRHDVKGFGLGLSYVKLMVEAHGGKVEVNSRIDQGTEVEIYLPLHKGDNG